MSPPQTGGKASASRGSCLREGKVSSSRSRSLAGTSGSSMVPGQKPVLRKPLKNSPRPQRGGTGKPCSRAPERKVRPIVGKGPIAEDPHGWSQRWQRCSARRLHGAVVVVVLLCVVLAGRLVQLQAVQAHTYASTALAGRLREQKLPATRGAILDSTGQVLASSSTVRNIVVDQTLVDDPAASAAALAPLLDMEVAAIEEKLTGKRRFVYVAKKIQPLTWREVQGLKIPGVSSEAVSDRTYPAGQLGANVLGFVGADGQGLEGLERTLDEELSGVQGFAQYEVDAGGRQIPLGQAHETPPVAGKDVQLTLNRLVQWKAQSALEKALKQWDADNGTVVVMDAHTGNIVALATSPTFDPNEPGRYPVQVRGDRSLSEVFEPGSTGKAITVAAAIAEGVATPQTVFTVPDHVKRAGTTLSDHERHPPQRLTLAGIVAQSSNVGTILTGELMSKDVLARYFADFGIGSRTGVALPGESPGLFLPVNQWSGTSAPTISYGHGYSVTTLQMASVYATLANGGVKMIPRIIHAVADDQGHMVPTPIPPGKPVVPPHTADAVSQMLEQVTGAEGTAPMTAIEGYRVAGKTGTAQRVKENGRGYEGYTASFIGYAPADAPPEQGKLVVAVTIHGPKNGYYGGQVAGPVFSEVMSYALQTLKITPTGSSKPLMVLQEGG